MKTCPGCGSIDSDEENVCGICGRSLATVPSESLDEAKLEAQEQMNQALRTRPKRNVPYGGLILLSGGLTMCVVGSILAAFTAFTLLGLLLFLPGVIMAVFGLDLIIGDVQPPRSPSVWNRTPRGLPPSGRRGCSRGSEPV